MRSKELYNIPLFGAFQIWYMLSKTLAEDAAWKFAKENGIDLVTINPGWVIGGGYCLLTSPLKVHTTFTSTLLAVVESHQASFL